MGSSIRRRGDHGWGTEEGEGSVILERGASVGAAVARLRQFGRAGSILRLKCGRPTEEDFSSTRLAAVLEDASAGGRGDLPLWCPVRLAMCSPWLKRFGSPPLTTGARLRYLKEMGWLFVWEGALPVFDTPVLLETRPFTVVPGWQVANGHYLGRLPEPLLGELSGATPHV